MVPNCIGCQIEREIVEEYSELGFHFAGQGLYEKGHLLAIMVNDKGEIILE